MRDQITFAQVSLKNILFATDFSAQSSAALPYASSIAREYGSTIFAVHVISLTPFTSSSPTIAWQAIAAQAVREAKESMTKLEPKLEGLLHKIIDTERRNLGRAAVR